MSSWTRTRLKHLAEIPIVNGVGEKGEHEDPSWPRYIRTTDIAGPRKLRPDTFKSLPPSVALRATVKKGDVLMTAAGATIGKSYLHASDELATYAGYLVRFRHRPEVEPRFIAYWTESHPYWKQIQLGAIKSTIENFSAGKYRNLEISIPSSGEQQAIADFLDRETARIDALLQKRTALIDLLQKRRKALIGLKVSGVRESEGFRRVPLKRMAVVTYGLGQPPPPAEEGVPIVRATNIQRGKIVKDGLIYAKLADIPLKRAPLLRSGEILVVRSGAYTGDSALITDEWTGAAPGYDLRLTPKPTAEPKFLAYQLLSAEVLGQIDLVRSRAAQPHLNAEDLGELRVYWPDLSDQRRIVEVLDASSETHDLLVAKQRAFVQLATERRSSLITAAVTGQLDVSKAA